MAGTLIVYSSVTNPPTLNDGLSVPDPGRTGTVLAGDLAVSIPMSNTTWTPTGGPVQFKEANVVPSSTTHTLITPADRLARAVDRSAEDQRDHQRAVHLLDRDVGGRRIQLHAFGRWSPSTRSRLIPVVAIEGSPVCQTPQAASLGRNQTATVTPSCTDVNNNFTPSAASIHVETVPAHGTATVQANGSILYDNDGGDGAASESFTYTATDAGGLVSNLVTVNITVLTNTCGAGPDIPPAG